MVRSKRWGGEQDALFSRLVSTGDINPSLNEPDYCFTVTQTFFPEFVGQGQTGRATAIQRMQRKFRRIQLDRKLHGGRRKYGGPPSAAC